MKSLASLFLLGTIALFSSCGSQKIDPNEIRTLGDRQQIGNVQGSGGRNGGIKGHIGGGGGVILPTSDNLGAKGGPKRNPSRY